jgi:hypothetical protein
VIANLDGVDFGDGTPTKASIAISGRAEVVFDHTRDACEELHYPDLSVRAFRDFRGVVRMTSSHFTNRAFVGSGLETLRPDCRVLMASHRDPDPAQFDGQEWIGSTWTSDGRTVYALLHNEYHGLDQPGRCPSGDVLKCWFNTITLAISRDGGRTFGHSPAPSHFVATVPYRYEPDAGIRGLLSPSSIVRQGGHYYVMAQVQAPGKAAGACVMRTRNLADPRSWRAWDGEAFRYRFSDPYREPPPQGRRTCEPIAMPAIQDMSHSLTYNEYLDRYMLIGTAARHSGPGRRTVWGIYFSLSEDLVHWSERKLIREAEFPWSFRCGDSDPILYPSLLDPRSRSRNFDSVGKRAFLYYTQFHYTDCKQTSDRDLIRVPVEFEK